MTRFWTPISHLMAADRPAKKIVTRVPEGDYTWADFQNHAAGLCEQLARQPRGRWLLSCESSYAFGVGLFALWHSGRIAVLPPNAQPDSLRESARGVKGFIRDKFAPGLALPALAPLAVSKAGKRWSALDPAKTALELFTSGSTGARRPVQKTLRQLERELTVLEKTFGARLGACDVHATVSHQHIYGLLFRLLWPLCAGRPFTENAFLFWEELAPRLAAGNAACLVSSPTHLERLSAAGESALRSHAPRLIFSSGGPLGEAAARQIHETTGHYPLEVFGSTETGGVAWRAGELLWRPLEGVVIAVNSAKTPSPVVGEGGDEGSNLRRETVPSPKPSPTRGEGSQRSELTSSHPLKVKSPFGPSKAWMTLGDCGHVLPDGRFRVAGRSDRIVKLAEKRLSLDDMERRLLRQPWIAAARVILLDAKRGDNRTALGAAVVLNSAGRAQLASVGRAALSADLRAYLQNSFDASTLPRSFRFIDALPMDALGKVSQAVLAPLFQMPSSLPTSPERLEETQNEAHLRYRCRVPETLAYLEGHFPGYPIVPGVVQLQWVVEAVTSWLGWRPVVRRLDAIKFKTPLLPGREFSLAVERIVSGSETQLRFSLANGETLYSSGRLILA